MDLNLITPVILTYNEEPNIARTLSNLGWANRIVVLDSGSTDGTIAILESTKNVTVFTKNFEDHASQWNHALSLVESEWVLSCDADYQINEALQKEIENLSDDEKFDGYFIPFDYWIKEQPLSVSILPPRCALFKKAKANFINDGHTQQVVISGATGELSCSIIHDDRKSFGRWFQNQVAYMKREAVKLRERSFRELSAQDKVRKCIFLAPLLVVFYCLFIKGGLLDGWRGLSYALQRGLAELILSFELLRGLFTGGR
jgi:glycosyltransferase involved in cell wall biosynthesis